LTAIRQFTNFEMADIPDIEEWAVNANDAVTVTLVNGDSATEFNPKFTYPIFGDQELIFGYKGLEINIQMDAKSLQTFVSLNYQEKLKGADVSDPLEILKEFLAPDTVYEDELKWKKLLDESSFQVPGQLFKEFTSKGDNYAIYKSSIQDATAFHLRMRIFVLLFIEAGSYIDDSDERWELYTLYKTTGKDPQFVGFSTVYPYFWYKDFESHDHLPWWPMRKRISQFVVLPPFQGLGLGAALYNALAESFFDNVIVREITVEDPSEAFDDLRDRCDLQRLAKQGVWTDLKLPLEQEWVKNTREQYKIAPRQFDRCLEMALLNNLGGKPDKPYRLFVKKRLFIRNQEALNDLDDSQRKDKLQETFDRLVEDYHRIMDRVDFTHLHKGKKRVMAD
jgi:histone acetyltransferase 1